MLHLILLKYNRISGSSNNALNFEYGDEVVAHNGCAATLFGQFWYFGGGTGTAESVNPYKKQVWVLIFMGKFEFGCIDYGNGCRRRNVLVTTLRCW